MLTQEPLLSHDGRPGERGSVVNIASQLGVVGRPNARELVSTVVRRKMERLQPTAAYCASKSAVIGMTRCDAIDVRSFPTDPFLF
jgi:NAD(P)-dependent dehydrogenase (short-subunit alcohol dehydrogenase family)